MKKIIGIVLSLAAVVTLSSFVIAHNVNNDKTDNPETISANDGWEYYKPVTVYYMHPNYGKLSFTKYIWKKTVCGDPDYLLSGSADKLSCTESISRNYNFGRDVDWTSEYKYKVSNLPCGRGDEGECYFDTYLQGWN